VFAWRRTTDRSTAVVAVNFAAEPRTIALPVPAGELTVVGTHLHPPRPDADGRLRLRPFEGLIVAGG
jgi:hypothetical protein